ncbi:MAG: OB-fold domain-containing protein [Lautropia sp.]
MDRAEFAATGTVWAATVIRTPVPGFEPPHALAYVDIDDGPRVLASVAGATAPVPGSRVRLATVAAETLTVEVL